MHDSIKSKLDENGYVVIEDFLLPAECDELYNAGVMLAKTAPIEDAAKTIFATGDNKQPKNEYFLGSNDKIRYFFEEEALDKDGKLKVDQSVSINKVGHALHLLHPLFRCYTYSARVKNICRELGFVEPSVVQSMYIYKNPAIGGKVVAHQDASYLYTEPKPPIGFWIALQDATIENGCLWIAAGSHKSGVHCRLIRNPDPTADEKLITEGVSPIYPESIFKPVQVKRGSCILIHGLVVHKSSHNKSDQSRHAYTFHVIEKHNNKYSQDNWLQEGQGAPFYNMYTTEQML